MEAISARIEEIVRKECGAGYEVKVNREGKANSVDVAG